MTVYIKLNMFCLIIYLDNVKASVCYHDQDMFERPLAVEEQKELIDILDDMSTNLEQLLSCYSI